MKLINLIQAICAVKKTEASVPIEVEAIGRALDLNLMYGDQPDDYEQMLRGFWLQKWLDTDTWVGWLAVYFKGEPAGCAYQAIHKNYTEVRFINESMAARVYAYMMRDKKPKFAIISADDTLYDEYTADYTSNILNHHGTYNGKTVTFLPDATREVECTDITMVVADEANVQFQIPVSHFRMQTAVDLDAMAEAVARKTYPTKEKPVLGKKYIKRASSRPHIVLEALHIDPLDPEFETSDEMISGRFMYPSHFVTDNLTVLAVKSEYLAQAKMGQALPARAFLLGYFIDDCECDEFDSLDDVDVTVMIPEDHHMDFTPGVLCSTIKEKVKNSV